MPWSSRSSPDRLRTEAAGTHLSSYGDDRWRTGGSFEELEREAHVDPESLWTGIACFADEREQRLARMRVS